MAKNKKPQRKKKLKGLRTPKTPISRLPKQRRDEMRKAMLLFIKDTHGALSAVNPDLNKVGVEKSLEVLEELHEHGYIIFERDLRCKRYGHRVWLYDDDTGVYDDMTNMGVMIKENMEEEEDFDEYSTS